MAVPAAATKTPQRTTAQYTVGDPDLRLKANSQAMAPNVGALAFNPHPVTLVGATVNSASVAIDALLAGASASFSFKIPLPGLPTPLVVGGADSALLVVSPVSISHARAGVVENAIPGLVIASFVFQPLAAALNGALNTGETLQAGQTYTGFQVLVSGTVTAVANTSAGVLTARAQGVLYDVLG